MVLCIFSAAPVSQFQLTLKVSPQGFIKGVVSDHELCTALGEKVLRDRGSSVDAAITGALCLGIVHPHVSGIGGYVLVLPKI